MISGSSMQNIFHAALNWRGEIEEDVLRSFGKDGARPARAILVATQIIEQSLDLDGKST